MVTLASPVARQLILAEHVANTTGFLLGTAGYGQLGRFNDISDATNYSVIIGNQDSTNGRALRVTYGTTASATTIATFAKGAISLDVLTAFKHADLTNPASGYTGIGARASDGRPVYYVNGGSQLVLANTSEVPSGILTTTGDIIYSSSGSTAARLGIGTTGYHLTVVGGVPAWAAPTTSVITTTGDLLYSSSGTTLARRGIGSTDHVLTVAGGVPTWAAGSKATLTTTGDVLYASSANTLARLGIGTAYFSLNVNAGATAPAYMASLQSLMTAQGDILQASAANTPARLAIGTARQNLQVNSGATALNYVASLQSLMTAQGDIVQASAANTPARLALGTARQTLLVNSGATALEYGASLQSLMTAQGDLVYASAANTPARLAKGTAGLVLTMNAGATAPEWAASAAAGMVKLGEDTSSGSDTFLEVTSISASYRSLYIELDGGRSDTASTAVGVSLTVESSPTAGAYDGQRLFGSAATVVADENIGVTDSINAGSVPGASSSANLTGAIAIRIPGYASTAYFKSVIIDSASATNIGTGGLFRFANMGTIELTAAISRVRLTLGAGNWTTTSRMTVWGLPT